MGLNRTCDGMRRRDFIQIGALGVAGLTLADSLRAESALPANSPKLRSAIFVNLTGGPSHLDSFDMKPKAPAEIRSSFDSIRTNVPGIEICEHLPKLAKQAHRFSILRGVSHTLAAHRLGSEYVNTGSRPLASMTYPTYGAVVSKESGPSVDMPNYVAIPRTEFSPGFLGVQHGALHTNAAPQAGRPFQVRGISMENGITIDDLERRNGLLNDIDTAFAGYEEQSELLTGLDRFGEQAFQMITSKRAREAFDISRESPAYVKKFESQPFAQSCLLATRLVESGVRFVTLTLGGWDTHNSNFDRLGNNLLPRLDGGLAPLLEGLDEKGLLDSTAVFVTGEFGRTPKINSRTPAVGRDHYPRCMFMLMAGGGVQAGQVVGESDETAAGPKHEAITPEDAAATFYSNIGIDPKTEYHSNSGRPITLVRDGSVIRSLLPG